PVLHRRRGRRGDTRAGGEARRDDHPAGTAGPGRQLRRLRRPARPQGGGRRELTIDRGSRPPIAYPSRMKWVTRENANVDRVACPWLIRRFIDPGAQFLFAARDEVLAVADREGAHSFDAPGAEYTHRDGLCSFEVLMDAFGLGEDAALARLASIV